MKAATYRVTRFCCRSGMCIECRANGNLARRIRITQADHLTEARAKEYVKGWREYDATLEPEAA